MLCYYYVFYQKQNVRAFIIILGVTMKAAAFKSLPEINGFVEKLVTFVVTNTVILSAKIDFLIIIERFDVILF